MDPTALGDIIRIGFGVEIREMRIAIPIMCQGLVEQGREGQGLGLGVVVRCGTISVRG